MLMLRNVSFHVGKRGAFLVWAGVSWFARVVYIATASVLVTIFYELSMGCPLGGGVNWTFPGEALHIPTGHRASWL